MITFLGMSNPTILQPRMSTTFLWLCGVAAVVVAVDFRQVRFPRVPILVLAFLGFCLLSLLWTGDREATWFAVLFYAGMAFLACLLVENMSGRLFVRSMSMGAILIVVLSVVAVWVGHPNALGPSGALTVVQGLYGNRNIMAYVMVIGIAALLADRYESVWGRIFKWVAVLVAVVVMYFVHSGTGTIAAVVVVGLALTGTLARRVPPRRRRWTGTAVLSAVAFGVLLAVVNAQRIVSLLGKDQTFSGRTPLWQGIIEVWSEAELWGYGWGSVWAYAWFEIDDSPVRDRINMFVGHPLNHGHNGVLDVLVQVGVIGTVIYVAIMATSVVRGLNGAFTYSSPQRSWALLAMAAVAICSVTEPLFAAPIGWFVVVAASSCTARLGRA